MSAIDEFLAHEAGRKEKTAAFPFGPGQAAGAARSVAGEGFKDTFKDALIGSAALATGGALVSAGIGGLEKLYDVMSNSISRSRGFKSMIETNPDLQKMDRTQVQRAYNTLHKFNPEMASDPLVSSSFVRRVAEMGAVSPQDVGNLAIVRDRGRGKSIFGRGKSIFERGLSLATPGVGAVRGAMSPDPEGQAYASEMGRARAQGSQFAKDLNEHRAYAQAYHSARGRGRYEDENLRKD